MATLRDKARANLAKRIIGEDERKALQRTMLKPEEDAALKEYFLSTNPELARKAALAKASQKSREDLAHFEFMKKNPDIARKIIQEEQEKKIRMDRANEAALEVVKKEEKMQRKKARRAAFPMDDFTSPQQAEELARQVRIQPGLDARERASRRAEALDVADMMARDEEADIRRRLAPARRREALALEQAKERAEREEEDALNARADAFRQRKTRERAARSGDYDYETMEDARAAAKDAIQSMGLNALVSKAERRTQRPDEFMAREAAARRKRDADNTITSDELAMDAAADRLGEEQRRRRGVEALRRNAREAVREARAAGVPMQGLRQEAVDAATGSAAVVDAIDEEGRVEALADAAPAFRRAAPASATAAPLPATADLVEVDDGEGGVDSGMRAESPPDRWGETTSDVLGADRERSIIASSGGDYRKLMAATRDERGLTLQQRQRWAAERATENIPTMMQNRRQFAVPPVPTRVPPPPTPAPPGRATAATTAAAAARASSRTGSTASSASPTRVATAHLKERPGFQTPVRPPTAAASASTASGQAKGKRASSAGRATSAAKTVSATGKR